MPASIPGCREIANFSNWTPNNTTTATVSKRDFSDKQPTNLPRLFCSRFSVINDTMFLSSALG